VSSFFSGIKINRDVYAKIEADAEYVPTNANTLLGDVNKIHSVIRCGIQCMFNELCLTATFYEDLKMCRLFAADSTQGTTSVRVKAKVINFFDRGKKHRKQIIAVATILTLFDRENAI
jgi:hypothetical protein